MAEYVGEITLGTGSVGTTYASATLPFTWSCVRFWVSRATATGASRDQTVWGYGISGGASLNACAGVAYQDSSAGADTGRGAWTDACVALPTKDGTLDGKAKCQAPSTQVVLEITDVFATAVKVVFVAYDDVTVGTPIAITEPGSTGSVAYACSGGTPTVTHIFGTGLGAGAVAERAIFNYGIGLSSSEQFVCGWVSDEANPTDTGWYNREGDVLVNFNANADDVNTLAKYGTDGSGITLNWTEVSGGTRVSIAVPLYGGTWSLGSFDMPTNTTPITETLDHGTSPPSSVVLVMNGNTAHSSEGAVTDSGGSDVRGAVGVFTSASDRITVGHLFQDATGTAEAHRWYNTDCVLATYGRDVAQFASVPVTGKLDVSAMGSGAAFTLVMDDVTAPVAYKIYYDAKEGAAAPASSFAPFRRRMISRRAD